MQIGSGWNWESGTGTGRGTGPCAGSSGRAQISSGVIDCRKSQKQKKRYYDGLVCVWVGSHVRVPCVDGKDSMGSCRRCTED